MALLAAVPDGDLVPPPQLARDAPGADVLHPVQVDAGPGLLGVEAHRAVAHHVDGRAGQTLDVAEPLQRDQRLDPPARAVRVGHVVLVRARARDAVALAQRRHHRTARVLDAQPGEALAGGLGHEPVLADHAHLIEPVPAAYLEVVGVVPRRDLQRAGAELGIHVLVGDDRQPAADDRQDRRLAHQARVALVVGVHRDRGVGEHRLGADGGHGHRARAGLQRVVDRVERVLDPALLDLQVGDRRARPRVPVDHVVVAVDEALLVERDEHVRDGLRVLLVHREALVLQVERGAQAAELLGDARAVLLAPLPDALHERLAADLLATRALVDQLLLDLHLCRDPGVVGAVDPLRVAPAHACDARADVLDRGVERVAHVQLAGHVGRRDGDGEVLLGGPLRLGVEGPGLLPAPPDALLGLGGLVALALLQVH